MRKGEIDWDLEAETRIVGGFSTTLGYSDRLLLRSITKRVHLAHLPGHCLSDLEADRVIDVMGPETVAYLIRHNLERKV